MLRPIALLFLACTACTEEKQPEHAWLEVPQFHPATAQVKSAVASKQIVKIALQTGKKFGEVAVASCISNPPYGNYDCEYSLVEKPSERLRATIVACDVAFYFKECPDHLGLLTQG